MSKLSRSLTTAALLAVLQPVRAEILPPGNRPLPPGHHALIHAKVVVKPGLTIDDATVIIRDGRIETVTEKGDTPDSAREWDMTGLTLYAGFIDPYVTEANPVSTTMTQSITGAGATASGKPGFLGAPGNELDPGTSGPGSGLSTMKPEHDVAAAFSPKPDTHEALRAQGFTAAVLTPASGIIRGQSALISLGQGSPNRLVIRPHLFQHIVFDTKASKADEYPKSLMGVIAAIRQTLSDAQHYNDIWAYHEANADTPAPPPKLKKFVLYIFLVFFVLNGKKIFAVDEKSEDTFHYDFVQLLDSNFAKDPFKLKRPEGMHIETYHTKRQQSVI